MTGRSSSFRGRAPERRLPSLSTDALLAEAVRQHRAGNLDEADNLYERILKARPKHPEALHLLGLAAYQRGNPERAEPLVRKALRVNAANAAFHNSLGMILMARGRNDDAVTALRQAIARDPRLAEAHNNLGNALLGLKMTEEAIAAYEAALRVRSDYAEAMSNLGSAHRRAGRLDEAEAWYRRAIACRPRYVTALSNLGQVLHEQARYEEALETLNQAIAIDPNHAGARANRAVLLLLLGHLDEGWRDYEWRWGVAGFTTEVREFPMPPWQGEDIRGRPILLHTEQGLGSAIQFVRFARQAADLGARVNLECQRPLARLFESLCNGRDAPVDRIVMRGDPASDCDVHAPLMSLPHLLGVDTGTVTAPERYVSADEATNIAWAERLRPLPGRRIGLAWAGNPAHQNDHNRSMPARFLLPLFNVADASLVSLQVAASTDGGAAVEDRRLVDLTCDIRDFADTAAMIDSLDLVISVDTAVAHLAGAMGRPVWTLLPFVPEWRWGREGETTPWYSSMRLFRQRSPGDWADVIAQVIDALPAVGRQG